MGVGLGFGVKATTSLGSLTSGNSLFARLGNLGMGVSSGSATVVVTGWLLAVVV